MIMSILRQKIHLGFTTRTVLSMLRLDFLSYQGGFQTIIALYDISVKCWTVGSFYENNFAWIYIRRIGTLTIRDIWKMTVA